MRKYFGCSQSFHFTAHAYKVARAQMYYSVAGVPGADQAFADRQQHQTATAE